MNERIKELLEQATEVYDQWHRGESVCMVDYKMFAELIVRECLEQVRDEVQYEYDWKLADAVSKRVLEHFGVKQ